jgi:FixJ family two-component response regulator
MYSPNPAVSAKPASSAAQAVVYVVDDDTSVRSSLESLFRSMDIAVELFATSEDFLACPKQNVPSCLVLDIRLRGENGLEFQYSMVRNGLHMPVVFVTGYGDIEMSVKAMKAGAFDFLAKPYRDQDMLDAVAHALAKDRERLRAEQSVSSLRAAYDSLTPREKEVVVYVLGGLLNKQIASEMNVSEFTVKMHRGQAMKKMLARSVADLVCKVRSLGIEPPTRR